MQSTVVSWLDSVGSLAFTVAAWGFLALNGFAVAVLAWKRDRALVNRWTAGFLAVNLILLGTGLGIPLATFTARTAVIALSPAVRGLSPARDVADSLAPHKLCNQLYALATSFTSFYEACPVLKAESPESRASRLSLSATTRRAIALGLELLGIAAPDRM